MKAALIALVGSGSGRNYLAVPVEDLVTFLNYKTFTREGYSSDAELVPGKALGNMEVVDLGDESPNVSKLIEDNDRLHRQLQEALAQIRNLTPTPVNLNTPDESELNV